MTTFLFETLLLLLSAVTLNPTVESLPTDGWTYLDFSQPPFHSVEAVLYSRDRTAKLAINCSHASDDPVISIQFLPDPNNGLGMAPIMLDWLPSKGSPLGSHLVWERDQHGAFVRDGEFDRDASDVSSAIEAGPGVISIQATDRNGDHFQTTYDSVSNREAIGRVLAQCPGKPTPQSNANRS
ncbi:hypothetical protein ACUXST_002011 [Sphingomonas sp. F9_3S_D5_B_2]